MSFPAAFKIPSFLLPGPTKQVAEKLCAGQESNTSGAKALSDPKLLAARLNPCPSLSVFSPQLKPIVLLP
jgi:hypothetical protein